MSRARHSIFSTNFRFGRVFSRLAARFCGLLCLWVLVAAGLPDAAGAAAYVSQDVAAQAALSCARERWPGCRLVSLTPYYALSGEVNAWAGQVVKDPDDAIQDEAGLTEAMRAAPAAIVPEPAEEQGEAAEASGESGRSPAPSRPDSGTLDAATPAAFGRGMPIPGEPGEPAAEEVVFDDTDRAFLADRVGTVLIAGRYDLYPLLERFDGVAPHLKFATGAAATQAARLDASTGAVKAYYLGPFHVVVGETSTAGGFYEAGSGRVLSLSEAQTANGPLPPAPTGKNELTPATLWAEVAGAPARKASLSAMTTASAASAVPETAKLIAGVPYYHQDDYGAEACGPVAAAQVLGYWDDHGFGTLVDNGSSTTGHVSELIYSLMRAQGYTAVGTEVAEIAPGLVSVCNAKVHGNALNFSTSSKTDLNWDRDLTAEINAGRPFIYVNTDPSRYPGWAHATTVVGYDDSDGHILYLHWNFPPDSPYELNWDNVPPDNELQIKVQPNTAPFACLVAEDFEGEFPGEWQVINSGQAAQGWSPASLRSHNQTPDPTPAGGTPAYALYCGGEAAAPGPYLAGTDTWLVRGPFSTLGKGTGEFSTYAWRDLADGDAISLLASLDGVKFYGSAWTGSSTQWDRLTLDLASVSGLGNVLNQPAVWLAARFKSASEDVAEGVYLDDLSVNLYAVNGWWWNASLPGSGVSMEVQGDNLFLAWYVYDASGRSVWYVCLAKRTQEGTYSGDLMESKGQPLGQPAGSFDQDAIGTVTVRFNSGNRAVLDWTLAASDVTGSVSLSRLLDDVAPGARDPRDLNGWWYAPDYPGMGFFLEAQGGMFYLAWYHYRDDGSARWWSLGGAPDNFPAGTRTFSGRFSEWSGGQTIGGQQKTPVSTQRNEASITFLQNGSALLVVDDAIYPISRFDFSSY